MIYTCKPNKLAIYVNSSRYTLDQVKELTGADVVVNGGLFNPDFTPCCHLKSHGVVYASAPWTDFGYGWHDDKADIRMTSQYSDLDNYISCVCLVYQGKAQPLSYPAELGGVRPRTLIGVYPDGNMVFLAGENYSPESLQTYCLSLGLNSALMLDGGGSSQGISPNGAYRQSRKVQNFILAWLTEACPYDEPTEEVGRPKPSWVKWLQWHLNRHGFSLEVDGIFGPLTHAAAVEFMSRYPNITADGIVGRLTRAKLKDYHPPDELEPLTASNIIKPNYAWAGTLAVRYTTDFIVLHHAGAKGSVMVVHQSHLANGWSGIGYHFYVRQDGTIYEGRPIDKVGAHCVPQDCNKRSVGVCFEGDFETETMSDAQLRAGKRLVRYIKSIYPSAVVKKHKDFDATACPGKNFPFAEIGG